MVTETEKLLERLTVQDRLIGALLMQATVLRWMKNNLHQLVHESSDQLLTEMNAVVHNIRAGTDS